MNNRAALMSTGNGDWQTPPEVIERVIAVLGAIDLDPCSNSHDDPNVPAAKHFTEEDDGLAQEWRGRVYMNPPYGRVIGKWVEKLVEEFEAGRVTQAIALVPARTDTRWFKRFRAFPRCFVQGRLKFVGAAAGAPFPSAIIGVGVSVEALAEGFGDIGDCFPIKENKMICLKMTSLGERLRGLRVAQPGLTLKEAARETGITLSYLSDIERGRTIPSLRTLARLATTYRMSVVDVLAGTEYAFIQVRADEGWGDER